MGIDNLDFDKMNLLLDELTAQGLEVVSGAGVSSESVVNRFTVDMRYVGQGHEITVPLPDRQLPTKAFLDLLLANFTRLYRGLFGRTVSAAVEVITWRLRASGEKDQIVRPHARHFADALKGTRPVYFSELGTAAETPVYDHYKLPLDQPIRGPAIIEQRESTAVVGPRGVAHVDRHGNLVINIH
jgi:N-methylhydantoinase A